MAVQEIIVRLVVEDSQLEQTEKDIKKLGGSIEKVEKTSKKAGSNLSSSFDKAGDAANNLQGGVEGAISQVRVLGKAAKTSGKAMRSALISTGIGALIVAVGFLVSNWEEIGVAVGLINKDLENQHDLLKSNLSVLDSELSLLKKQGKFNKDNNLSNKENIHSQRLLLIEKKRILALDIANLETQLLKEQSAAKELTFWQKLVNFRSGNAGNVTAGVVDKEEQVRIDDLIKQINVLKGASIDASLEFKNIGKEPDEKNKPKPKGKVEPRDKAVSVDAGIESGIADPFNEQKEKDALRLQALREGTEEFAIAEQERIDLEVEGLVRNAAIENQKTQNEKDGAEARVKIADAEFQAKQMLLDGISGSLDAASELAGRNTAAGKALAVASALIDTYAAIAGQLKAFSGVPVPGFAIAQAVATGVAGFAAVKNILSVKVPNESGGGGQGGSFSGGGGASAPSFNVVGTSGVNQLGQTLANDNTPIKAYVVGADVTSQQEFDRNIVDTPSIG